MLCLNVFTAVTTTTTKRVVSSNEIEDGGEGVVWIGKERLEPGTKTGTIILQETLFGDL